MAEKGRIALTGVFAQIQLFVIEYRASRKNHQRQVLRFHKKL